MTPTINTRSEIADTEATKALSLTRPLIFGTITFFALELLIACLLNTQVGQMLLAGRTASSLSDSARSLVHLGLKIPLFR